MIDKTDFTGALAEPHVGEIHAVRTFHVGDDGLLYPISTISHGAWVQGENAATCGYHNTDHEAADRTCTCGFYAFGNPQWADQEYHQFRYVQAVVACYGQVTVGTKGLRAQKARIEAIWFSRSVPKALIEEVGTNYPEVAVHRSQSAMLEEHPLTQMPDYVAPAVRWSRPGMYALIGVWMALMISLLVAPAERLGLGPWLNMPVAAVVVLATAAGLHRWEPQVLRWLRANFPVVLPIVAMVQMATVFAGEAAWVAVLAGGIAAAYAAAMIALMVYLRRLQGFRPLPHLGDLHRLRQRVPDWSAAQVGERQGSLLGDTGSPGCYVLTHQGVSLGVMWAPISFEDYRGLHMLFGGSKRVMPPVDYVLYIHNDDATVVPRPRKDPGRPRLPLPRALVESALNLPEVALPGPQL